MPDVNSPASSGAAPAGLFVSRDLFFGSQVTGAAAALGQRVAMESDLRRAAARAAEPDCRCVILDLGLPGLSPAEFIGALPAQHRPRVIAFDAHVNEARLAAARAAGCSGVYTRGQFSASLPSILRECLSPESA
jgi:DNA-binding NarL/FixJ family response regulator